MNRKLKFRAWDKKYKQMYGPGDIRTALVYPDEDIEIMQFTGLLDRNGKEVFEGDIVNLWATWDSESPYITGRGEIFWDEEESGFLHTWNEWFDGEPSEQWRPSKKLWLSKLPKIDLEVIGNIYENPELLKQ